MEISIEKFAVIMELRVAHVSVSRFVEKRGKSICEFVINRCVTFELLRWMMEDEFREKLLI